VLLRREKGSASGEAEEEWAAERGILSRAAAQVTAIHAMREASNHLKQPEEMAAKEGQNNRSFLVS
jgi:hypothetical protein